MGEKVYIALGSNLDEPAVNLQQATTRLADLSDAPLLASSIWQSMPEGFSGEVPDFCNAVVMIETGTAALELLGRLQQIESGFGRHRRVGAGYQSRRLDLDIIDFGGQQLEMPGLTVPHPRAATRQFVLVPLREIDPGFRFPGLSVSLDELIRRAPENTMTRTIPLIPSA